MNEIERRRDPIAPAAIWLDREVDTVTGKITEVHHHYHAPDPAPVDKGPLERFTPYFVISAMTLVLLGGLGIISMILIPPFMAAVLALAASFVSITIAATSALVVIGAIIWLVRMMLNDSREHSRNE